MSPNRCYPRHLKCGSVWLTLLIITMTAPALGFSGPAVHDQVSTSTQSREQLAQKEQTQTEFPGSVVKQDAFAPLSAIVMPPEVVQ